MKMKNPLRPRLASDARICYALIMAWPQQQEANEAQKERGEDLSAWQSWIVRIHLLFFISGAMGALVYWCLHQSRLAEVFAR